MRGNAMSGNGSAAAHSLRMKHLSRSFHWIPILLTCSLLLTPVRAAAQPSAQLMNLRKGTPVTVWLHSGERLQGNLGAVGTTSFEMTVAYPDRIEDKAIPIPDLRKIRRQGHTGPGRRVAGGALTMVATSMAITAPFLIIGAVAARR
jgi:hypothetical protein